MGMTTVSRTAPGRMPVLTGTSKGFLFPTATASYAPPKWNWKRTTLGRPVKARARRMPNMTASVPELTNSTRSAEGTSRWMRSAQSTARSQAAPNCVPFSTWACTAATTAGCAWPSTLPPCPP